MTKKEEKVDPAEIIDLKNSIQILTEGLTESKEALSNAVLENEVIAKELKAIKAQSETDFNNAVDEKVNLNELIAQVKKINPDYKTEGKSADVLSAYLEGKKGSEKKEDAKEEKEDNTPKSNSVEKISMKKGKTESGAINNSVSSGFDSLWRN